VPDVLSHLCSGFLLKATSRGGLVPVFVAGAVLPDLLSRVPSSLLTAVNTHLFPVPAGLIHCWGPLHLPAGILCWCLLLSFAFPAPLRGAVFGNLLGGAALHMGLDLLQSHVGVGYALLFPLSGRDFELGLMGSEASVLAAPLVAVLTVVFWRLRRPPVAAAASEAGPEARPRSRP